MDKYGTVFYRSIWTVILRHLPERYWYKLKIQNKAFYQLIKNSCSNDDDIKTLILDGKIESLIKENTRLNINHSNGLKWACQGDSKNAWIWFNG